VVPSPHEGDDGEGLGPGFREALDRYHDCMGRLEFHRALEAVWGFVSRVNKFIVAHEPWKEFQEKGRTDALARCLYEAAEAIRAVTLLITPVMPGSARRIYAMLGLPDDPTGERLDEAAWGELPPGGKLGTREALFPRLKKQETLAAIGKRREASMVEEKPRTKPEPKPTAQELGKEPFPETDDYISIDDFAKVDLRVGAIAEAVRVEGTDKLVRMRVDLGSETRQLVAGIGGKYEPEQLVGKKIIVVANLRPATIRGVRSEGMLLAAVDGDHLSVATLDRDISPGSTIR
jgi:methionyl-tRNA synthetase